MKDPLFYRKEIPFYYDKSEKEIKADVYERYDPMVLRQSLLHLADELWGTYPLLPLIEFAAPIFAEQPKANILEVGCSVGRWIASVAQSMPGATCWGVDFSYQLLKQAHTTWIAADDSTMNLSRYGFSSMHKIKGRSLNNLQFGLAKAEQLPFAYQSQDIVLQSFLFDRLTDPVKGIQEMHRILKPGGKMVLVTPLNFSKAKSWNQFYPPVKISQLLLSTGFKILEWQENFMLDEPLDRHGNKVQWNCIAAVLEAVEIGC